MQTELDAILGAVPAFDAAAAARAEERWSGVAKPLNSLGILEKIIVRIAGVTGDPFYRIDKRALLICCADNGVVRQGISQVGSEVTAALARALARGDMSVCKMARIARVDIIGVDMGMEADVGCPELVNRRLGPGTRDLSEGPAMSRDVAVRGILHGYDLVRQCRERGYKIVATGELGIGNTTTSSAIAAVLLDRPVAEVTGRGAGLSGEGLRRKVAVIEKAIAVNRPDPADPLGVLAMLGGFDIAGLVGVYIGAAAQRLPVLVDGLISSVAALLARRLCPATRNAMIASHVSAEPSAGWLLDALDLQPLITAGMHLGEGTGAVAALPLLDMAYAVYSDQTTFDGLSIERYQPLV